MRVLSGPQVLQLVTFQLVTILAAALAVALIAPSCLFAQVSGSISGTVLDSTAAVVAGAKVALLDEASKEARETVTNSSGYFTFSAVTPGTYTVSAEATGFKVWKRAGVEMHTGDVRTLSNVHLTVGATSEVIEVTTVGASVAVDSGAREDLLSARDIQDLPLVSRNVSELVKVLPGVTSTMNGTSNGAGFMNFLNTGANGSAIGVGLDINGAAYRGGTSYINDGANIIDPGCNCWSIALVNSKMTQEVQVQTSNFGADVQKGPVVVNSIGKSGTKSYHSEGYFDARNDILNANDWQDNNLRNPRGSGHYYYPGFNFGGPVPFTKKKVFFWFGYEHFLQNTGTASPLASYIPAAGMMAGSFTSSGAGVTALCPNLDANGNSTDGSTHAGTACASINGMVLPDGTTVANGIIPSQYLDPGAAALAKIWPAANITDPTEIAQNNGNYLQSFPAIHDGYMYRMRYDYDLNDSNKFFVSFQYGTDAQPVNSNGAHVYYTPGNAIPFPDGGIQTIVKSKVGTAHFVHVFSPTMTNEFVASWGWGSGPFTANLDGVQKAGLGYTYASVFKNPSITMIPSYYSAGNFTYPEFSQPDVFEPGGSWNSKKQMPSFADNFTKVWRTHTLKFGGYYENTGNLQAGYNFANGVFSYGGQNPDFFNPSGPAIGSSVNPLADFATGIASNYQETSAEPYQDMAYRTLSGYFDDSWKASRRLTVQWGFRFDHIGRWYDRQGVGMAAFFPNLVAIDEATGRGNPGVRYHGVDPGVSNGGSPVRPAFVSPRFGIAYDVFGTGKTVIRGGWGKYRWNDQVNDYLGTLEVSQGLLTYNLPGKTNVVLSQVGALPAPVSGVATPGAINGSIYAADPSDNEIPLTTSYNLTISQETKWRSIFQVAYVGSQSTKLLIGGQNGIGNLNNGGAGSLIDRNKMPLGALFLPDPVTGVISSDPENISKGAPNNQEADYRPYGSSYGTNSVVVPEHIGYSNYNALQMSWAKTAGALSFNLNYTFSKNMGTALAINPFSLAGNYGVLNIDRPHVINTSYSYRIPASTLYHGNSSFVRGALGGWTVAGLTTWQSGANMPANYSPNFGFSYNYTDLPSGYGSTSIGSPTYFGTTAPMSIMPALACDPKSNLVSNQAAKLSCFAPPTVGQGQAYRNLPYIKGPVYWNSDLSIGKSFHITERQALEVRAAATNWLNHPLVSFSGNGQLQLIYTKDFQTGAIAASPNSTNWGTYNTKVGQPNERIMLLSVKYSF